MAAVTENTKRGMKFKKIVISETTGPIGIKLCLDSSWMIPFHICIPQSRPSTNMATVVKNRKSGDEIIFFPLKLLGQLDPSFAKIILWWSPFTILSGSTVLEPRWTLVTLPGRSKQQLPQVNIVFIYTEYPSSKLQSELPKKGSSFYTSSSVSGI